MSKTDNAKHPLDYLEAHTSRLDDACTYARELETRNKQQGVEIAALKAKQQELENALNERVKEVQSARNEVASAKARETTALSESTTLKEKVTALEEEIKKINETLVNTKQKIKESESSTTPRTNAFSFGSGFRAPSTITFSPFQAPAIPAASNTRAFGHTSAIVSQAAPSASTSGSMVISDVDTKMNEKTDSTLDRDKSKEDILSHIEKRARNGDGDNDDTGGQARKNRRVSFREEQDNEPAALKRTIQHKINDDSEDEEDKEISPAQGHSTSKGKAAVRPTPRNANQQKETGISASRSKPKLAASASKQKINAKSMSGDGLSRSGSGSRSSSGARSGSVVASGSSAKSRPQHESLFDFFVNNGQPAKNTSVKQEPNEEEEDELRSSHSSQESAATAVGSKQKR